MNRDSFLGSSASRWVQTLFYTHRMRAFPKTKMRRLSVPGYDAAEVLLSLKSPEEIEDIIEWIFANPFWSSIVVSVAKLVRFLSPIEKKMEDERRNASNSALEVPRIDLFG